MIKKEMVYADFRRQRVFYLVIGIAAMIVFVYLLDRQSWTLYPLEAAFLIMAFVQIYLHFRGERRDIFMRQENGYIRIYRPTITGLVAISIDPNEVTKVAEQNFGSVVSFKVYFPNDSVLTISPERMLWMAYDGRVRDDSKDFLRGIFNDKYIRQST